MSRGLAKVYFHYIVMFVGVRCTHLQCVLFQRNLFVIVPFRVILQCLGELRRAFDQVLEPLVAYSHQTHFRDGLDRCCPFTLRKKGQFPEMIAFIQTTYGHPLN